MTQDCYVRVFEELKRHQDNLQPQSILTDFERPAINAFQVSFPDSEHRGCFFHFSQNILRKINDISQIRERYVNEVDFAHNIKKLVCLAFVPVNDVIMAFEQLTDTAFFTDNEDFLADLMDYFEDNYIGRILRHRRRAPMYAIDLWNCHDAVVDGIPKTNNNIEGWHRRFSSLIGASHPTIWKFIDALKKEESLVRFKLNQYEAGLPRPLQSQICRVCTERVQSRVNLCDNNDILEYLNTLSHNINLNV